MSDVRSDYRSDVRYTMTDVPSHTDVQHPMFSWSRLQLCVGVAVAQTLQVSSPRPCATSGATLFLLLWVPAQTLVCMPMRALIVAFLEEMCPRSLLRSLRSTRRNGTLGTTVCIPPRGVAASLQQCLPRLSALA